MKNWSRVNKIADDNGWTVVEPQIISRNKIKFSIHEYSKYFGDSIFTIKAIKPVKLKILPYSVTTEFSIDAKKITVDKKTPLNNVSAEHAMGFVISQLYSTRPAMVAKKSY
jgi:hypothetical protein